jgi:hypothetical protein
MNNDQFNKLLNAYLDGELPTEHFAAFKQALLESPTRQREFRFQRRLRLAQPVAVQRQPVLEFGLPSANRLHRFGTLFGNAAVLVFVLGLSFQAKDPMTIDSVPPSRSVPGSAEISTPRANTQAPLPFFSEDTTDVSPYPDTLPDLNSGNAASDLGVILPSEEYGFVRL